MTAVATHLVMSFAQTLMHYKLGHHPMGGKFFRNHINFHHTYYSKDHLVSRTYLGDEGNNTPFFFIPVFLVGACTYLLLPFDLFVVQVVACAASFYAHVFFDKEYHVEGSRLQRFAWFRRKQELHFVHHRHANSNFAVIHFFWDRILGTYRRPDAGQTPLARSSPLRFANPSPPSGWIEDLHLQAVDHARHTVYAGCVNLPAWAPRNDRGWFCPSGNSLSPPASSRVSTRRAARRAAPARPQWPRGSIRTRQSRW